MTKRAHRTESLTQDGSPNRYAGQCSLCRADVSVGEGVLRAAEAGRKLHLVCPHCDSIPTPTVAARLSEFTGEVVIAGRSYPVNRHPGRCTGCETLVDAGQGVAVKPHPRARWQVKCHYCTENNIHNPLGARS